MMPPPLGTHTVHVTHFENKPWWVFWRDARVLKTDDVECGCDMAPFWRALKEGK